MQLGSRFQQYSVQKANQLASRSQPQYQAYLHTAQQHAKVLDAAVAELEAKADATHKQKADGEAFRGNHKLAQSLINLISEPNGLQIHHLTALTI